MRGGELLDKMNFVLPAYIEAADNMSPKAKPLWRKRPVAAACIALAAIVILYFVYPAQLPTSIYYDSSQNGSGQEIVISQSTSDVYSDLWQLLADLSVNENHDGDSQTEAVLKNTSCFGSNGDVEEEKNSLVENTGVALSNNGTYAYHIGENAVQISLLNGEQTSPVGSINVLADGIFVCNNTLLVVSQFASGNNELTMQYQVSIGLYDITEPQKPVLMEEYTQLGQLTACWMVNAELYVVTNDGICACGWSRREGTSPYYPQLSRNGQILPWNEENISILGEPTRLQYTAITVINGNSREVVHQQALYGDIQQLFYGENYIAATVAGKNTNAGKNPEIYIFDGHLQFIGKINATKIIETATQNQLQASPWQNDYQLQIVSLTQWNGIYRILGSYSNGQEKNGSSWLMAIAADMQTGQSGLALLSAAEYPQAAFTEILWEENRAIACVRTVQAISSAEVNQETRFLFVEFDGLHVQFYETELQADYLNGRVGCSYGNPLGNFATLIPMGNGIYLRYCHLAEGPGGFDVFDFSDSAAAKLIYRSDASLSGKDAFDYIWYVYDNQTFGTLKVLLGDEDYFRDVRLSWCVYKLEIDHGVNLSLQKEYPLQGEIKTFFGADDIGFSLFTTGKTLYYVMENMSCTGILP